MVIQRGAVVWADLGPRSGSRPANDRPVLVIQGDTFNESRLATVIVVVITSNTALATMPGNVLLSAHSSGLPKDSIVDVTEGIRLVLGI